MLTTNLYKIYIYLLDGSLAGLLKDYKSFKFGEKLNGFQNLEIQMNANRLPSWAINALKRGCTVQIRRLINADYKVVWAGRMVNKKDWEVNNLNVRTQTVMFKHFGQDFLDNVPITKNYNIPTDEGLILSDMIIYSQTSANWSNLPTPVVLSSSETNFGISLGSVDLTSKDTVIDFSVKPVPLTKAVEQLVDTKDPNNLKKQFEVSPTFRYNDLNKFYFRKDTTPEIKAIYSGRSSTGLKNYTKQSIVKLTSKSTEFKNVIIGQGDAISISARSTAPTEILQTYKARYKEESFKNVKDLDTLEDLTAKSLNKNENPQKLVDIVVMSNDEQIGNYSVGDYIRIDWENTDDVDENVKGDYRLYEFTINFDNLNKETVELKLALDDPVELYSGDKKAVFAIKSALDRLTIIEKN